MQEISREVLERYLVALFVLAILAAILLHSVVGEVDIAVTQVLNIIFEAGGPDVALLVKVATVVHAFDNLCQGEHSDVELPHGAVVPEATANEQRTVYILLYDPLLVLFGLLEKFLDLLDAGKDHDAVAAV